MESSKTTTGQELTAPPQVLDLSPSGRAMDIIDICEAVADGHDIGAVAGRYGLTRGKMMRWILALQDRHDRFKVAERARHEAIDAGMAQLLFEASTFEPEMAFDNEWNLKDLDQVPPDVRRCITKVKKTTHKDGSSTVEVGLVDRLRAVEMLSSMRGLFKKDVNVNMSFTQLVEKAIAR